MFSSLLLLLLLESVSVVGFGVWQSRVIARPGADQDYRCAFEPLPWHLLETQIRQGAHALERRSRCTTIAGCRVSRRNRLMAGHHFEVRHTGDRPGQDVL